MRRSSAVDLANRSSLVTTTTSSAIAALKEPRRTATVAALFYTLEASAQDDAIELGDALIADLFRKAELAQANHRHAHQRSLDAAIVLLRDLAGLVTTDDKLPQNDWRDMVYRQMPKENIEGAILAVDALVKPAVGKPYAELTAAWRRARKLFFSVTTRIDAAASPGGADVVQAMEWLRSQPDWSKMSVSSAPTAVISKAGQPHVMNQEGEPSNARAYVFATIDAWRKAIKRRDIYASPGIRYADPRLGMLEGRVWHNSKGVVCRSLNRSLNGAEEIGHLVDVLDITFRRVAARADQNSELRFEVAQGKRRIVVSKLDRMAEPDSLIQLRNTVHRLMPRAGIPDILLEVMRRTGFAGGVGRRWWVGHSVQP